MAFDQQRGEGKPAPRPRCPSTAAIPAAPHQNPGRWGECATQGLDFLGVYKTRPGCGGEEVVVVQSTASHRGNADGTLLKWGVTSNHWQSAELVLCPCFTSWKTK